MEKQGEVSLQIPYERQNFCVILICFGFLSIFTAYSPLEGVITKLYINFGHENFGPLSLGIIYLSFALSTAFVSSIIKAFGFKIVLMLGALAYTLFQFSGLLLYYYGEIRWISWVAVTIPAFLCGFSAACIWVAQSGYIGNIVDVEHRDQLFGISVAFRGIATLIGYFLNFYLLTAFGSDVYFMVLIPVGVVSVIIFYFLPYTKEIHAIYSAKVESISIMSQFTSYFRVLKQRQNFSFYASSLTTGIIGAMSTILFYQIGLSTMPQRLSAQPEQLYIRRQNGYISLFLLYFGVSQVVAGFVMKKLAEKWNQYWVAFYGSYLYLLVSVLTCVAYCLQNFTLNCFFSFIWGLLFTLNRSNCLVLFSNHFKNNLTMFGVYQFFTAIGYTLYIFLMAVTSKVSILISFLLIIVSFVVIVQYSSQFKDMGGQKGAVKAEMERELIEKK